MVKISYFEFSNETGLLDALIAHIDNFGKQHKHSTNQDSIGALQEIAYKYSCGHLKVDVFSNNQDYYNAQLNFNCIYCGQTFILPIANGKTLGMYIETVEDYAKSHAHNKTHVPNAQDLYYYKPSNQISFFKNAKVTAQEQPVTIPQEILKEIYKLSDFNVEPQTRVKGSIMGYESRAICTYCQSELPLNINDLLKSVSYKQTDTWQSLTKFCKEHKHEVTFQVGTHKSGRMFKDL